MIPPAARRLALAAPLLAACLVGTAARAEVSARDEGVLRAAVERFIRPGYARLAEAAEREAATAAALCAAPSNEALATAQAAFAGLVEAHARIEFVRFGPVAEDNRIERFLFWPDRRGIALRQVQGIIASNDESAADARSLHAKSVAVGGLNALEFVLFGTDADTLATAAGGFRCRYGAAVAGNLAAMAAEISAGWAAENGIAERIVRPDGGDPTYRTARDSLGAISGILIFGLEATRDLRIRPALGDAVKEAKPNLLVFRRSGLTAASLAGNLAGFQDLFEAADFASLLPDDARWIGPSAGLEFETAERALGRIGHPLADALGDPEDWAALTAVAIATSGLRRLFAEQMAPALGISAGFSSLDGD